MKSRASLTLMELLIMVLVFALAAALCLQAFAGADRISRDTEALDRAVLEVQNVAETLKSCSGQWETAAERYGGVWDGAVWTIEYEFGVLRAVPEDSGVPGLGQAKIVAADCEGVPLYSLTTGWQEGGSLHG